MIESSHPVAPIAILTGGLATQLTLTKTIPKSLLEVAGEPFIGRQLELLKASGLHRVVICTAILAR